jgi:hypothetical protein
LWFVESKVSGKIIAKKQVRHTAFIGRLTVVYQRQTLLVGKKAMLVTGDVQLVG